MHATKWFCLQRIFATSLRVASAASGKEEHGLLCSNCTRLCDYFIRYGLASALRPPGLCVGAIADVTRNVVTVASECLTSSGGPVTGQLCFVEKLIQPLLFFERSALMGLRTELSFLEGFLEQLTKLPKSAGATSDLHCLTCVSYVVAKLANVAIIGAAPRAQEVAVQPWLPLFAGRSSHPLFDRASNPDVRVLTLPEDVDTLLKPTSKFVQAVTYWAEVQVNATDTGFAMDNVKNIFKGSFKLLHESNTDSPHLSELAGLVIACILKQRGLMHVATTLNACMTWSKIP